MPDIRKNVYPPNGIPIVFQSFQIFQARGRAAISEKIKPREKGDEVGPKTGHETIIPLIKNHHIQGIRVAIPKTQFTGPPGPGITLPSWFKPRFGVNLALGSPIWIYMCFPFWDRPIHSRRNLRRRLLPKPWPSTGVIWRWLVVRKIAFHVDLVTCPAA